MIDKEHPLIPKDPAGLLKAIVVGRLSKPKPTEDQTEQTIESSMKVAKEYLERVYDGGRIECRCLGEQISGLIAERATILEIYELVETGQWDLVIVEDLSRLYRNPRLQYAFVQDMVDVGTRFIAVGDCLDTLDENWETMLCVATVRHGMVIPDTRRRVRRTAKYVFHTGGMVMKVRYGYRKLTREEAKSGTFGPKGLREAKVPEATSVWKEIRRRLMETKCPTSVVEWLKEEGIEPGRHATKWTVVNLKNAACDPKLHGTRLFRRKIFTRIYKTGRFKRQPNPNPERQYVAELAHMTLAEQESMLATVGWQIDSGASAPKRPSPRRGMARNRVLFPCRSVKCGPCAGQMTGEDDHVRCPRALKKNCRTCWNRLDVPLKFIREKVHAWLVEELESFPSVREAFVEEAWREMQQRCRKRVSSATLTLKEIDRLKTECDRLNAAIKLGGPLESLVAELAAVEQQKMERRMELSQHVEADNVEASCDSKQYVEDHMAEVLWHLMCSSFEFNELMQRLFPEFVIVPVQALDSGQVHGRGKIRFQAEPPTADCPAGRYMEVVLDFFEPPVHIKLLPQIVKDRNTVDPKTGKAPSYKKIADKVGTSYMTVKRALGYARLMEAEGLTDPFRELTEPPRRASRWLNRDKPRHDEAA